MHFVDFYLNFFVDNLDIVADEHNHRLDQDISPAKKRK